jgi:uncharacterized membrane protein YjjB (DUF3815 family)
MKKIEPDKWKHFYVGAFLGAAFLISFNYFLPFRQPTIIVISLGLVAFVSYVFELFSLVTGKGHYETADAIASIIGGLTGIGVSLLLLHYFF